MAGRALINLHAYYWYTHNMRNWLKRASNRAWNPASAGNAWPDYCDADGYPNADLPSSLQHTVRVGELETNYTGNWVIGWTGKNATSRLSGPTSWTVVSSSVGVTATPAAGNLTFSGPTGRIVFNSNSQVNTWNFWFILGALGWDGTLSGMYLCKEADLAGAASTSPADEFAYCQANEHTQDFLDYIAEVNPKVIRYVESQDTNGAYLHSWSSRPKITEFSYANDRPGRDIWCGVLTGDQDYTCALPSGLAATWTDMEVFTCYIGTTNTGSGPTIDVGGRGAKTVVQIDLSAYGAAGLSVGYKRMAYDALNDVLIGLPNLLTHSWPDETCIQLANKTSTDVWLCNPYTASDDFITQRATLARTTLDSGLKFYNEVSNENWNPVSPFYQHYWFRKRGFDGLSLNANETRASLGAQGLRIRQTMGLITAAWSPRTMTELVRMACGQGAGTPAEYETYMLLGTNLGAYGYDTAPERPVDYIDAFGVAPYIEGANVKQFSANYAAPIDELTDAVDDYISGDPTLMESALDWLHNDFLDGTKDGVAGAQTLSWWIAKNTTWCTMLAAYGVEVVHYEGAPAMATMSTSKCTSLGISTDYSAQLDTFLLAYKNNWRSKLLMYAYLKQHADLTNHGLVGVFADIGIDPFAMRPTFFGTPYELENGFRLYNNSKVPFHLGA